MTVRRPLRLLAVLTAGLAAPAAAQDTAAGGRCVLDFSGNPPTTRSQLSKLASGKYNAFLGGGVVGTCQGQDVTLTADSAEYYGDQNVLYLIGRVHYVEPRVTVDSERMTYWTNEQRLLAERNVFAVLPSGTTMRGPRAEYFRAIFGLRPRAKLIAPGRPVLKLVQHDSLGRPAEPVNLVANQVVADGDSLVYASGRVEITRPDLLARGDSAALDSGRETARLMRNPSIESRGPQPFTLSGGIIDVFSRQRQLERVLSRARAVATSKDLRLTSDTIDLRVAANRLQRAFAWGASRARVTSPGRDIVADSLDVIMPSQQVREVRALRRAYAESDVDTTKIASRERDWLRGDTVVARFDSVQSGDTARRPQVRDLNAVGHASSWYQIPSRQGRAARPSINYVRGSAIAIDFRNQLVQTVTVREKAVGMLLEPTKDSLDTSPDSVPAPVRADTSAARAADSLRARTTKPPAATPAAPARRPARTPVRRPATPPPTGARP